MIKIRKIPFLIGDVVLIGLAVWFSFLLRFEWQIPVQHIQNMWGIILLSLIVLVPVFYFFKLYSFSWSYVSTEELISLIKATTAGFLFLTAILFLFGNHPVFSGFPRSTLFISYGLIVLFAGGTRFLKRIYLQVISNKYGEEKERTLIVGAGQAGEQILRSILNSPSSPFSPIGFVDENAERQGILIHGLKVLGTIDDICDIISREKVEGMIVALPSAGSKIIRNAVEKGRKAGLKKIKIIPSLSEIIDSQFTFQSLREVEVEDLLGRKPVTLNKELIVGSIRDKTILITGAAGSIGSELSRQVAKFNPASLLLLDQDETGIFNMSREIKNKFPPLNVISLIADIRDKAKINKIFKKFRPDAVFHAAAYKHVPLMEEHSDEAVKNNVFGTKTVAEAALAYGTEKFIFISTDKAVNPSSVMGATKRVGEMICQSLNNNAAISDGRKTRFISVRFGNVLNSRGSVIPTFREQIKKGGPIEVTHPDMKRYFMITPEACVLVMQAGAMGEGGEVFVLDMGEPIKILDLAKELIRLSGFEPDKDIPIVFTEPRPGEKIFEEILSAEEGTLATQHQSILKAKLSGVDEGKLISGLEKMKIAAEDQEKEMIIKALKELIPTFNRPNVDLLSKNFLNKK